ncbi:hypothetical protein DPMN_109852 [Dreissena polymorpha]|uniref:Uncharacterized protein n=1 Tax=Dreissena polymorpha TaxID=45954 RepID=A0A9D4KB09_DREPO|nr:hypothetical protein DPMN_109852 [Dreissena polymorpha]
MFKCLYSEFCVRFKCPGLAAVEYDGDYELLVEPVLGCVADETACPQHAQYGHRCGRHVISYLEISGSCSILGQGCALVLDCRSLLIASRQSW